MNQMTTHAYEFETTIYLHFEDGTSFKGKTNLKKDDPRLAKGVWGEAAFTTGMTGYEETTTDPSFLGQHIVFTNSHIGNYDTNFEVFQSDKVHASSIIARNISNSDFVKKCNVPLISDIDTRALTHYLRDTIGTHKSVITLCEKGPQKSVFDDIPLDTNDLNKVSIKKSKTLIKGKNPIVLLDYGVKKGIIDYLIKLDRPLVQLPYNSTAQEVLNYDPSLIFLSNGPGDPRKYQDQINVVKELVQSKKPIRGICLGHQLLTLALGGEVIKLPFGQRGANHPVLNHITGDILITSQNHGYASSEESLIKIKNNNLSNSTLHITARSLFDKSVEAIETSNHFIKSVQYHPEANPGPKDGKVFFDEINNFLNGRSTEELPENLPHQLPNLENLRKNPLNYKKILLIGSGPIKIGQASEFDYSGTQACKSLKEQGIEVILLNSNPATIMTDKDMAHRTYIEPITKETITKIIKKENVDALLSTMGGQTALNLCVELENEGILKELGVKLLGANVETIEKTEDRELFAIELKKLGYQAGRRFRAKDKLEANSMATSQVGYPLIIRRDFALGGKGAALVHNSKELNEVLESDISYPITMEKSLMGWKEVELEVMVDCERSGVVICSIENVDPCGTHTGDSITVAPAQTISDYCYQKLRTMSLTIAKHMNVVAGGANVQFAINPLDEDDIVVIEMNPRVSRSSALASKATGYPIAKISAQLAIGLTLKEILNDITQVSPVAFEPTLDYVAVKIPIFPFNKFPSSSRTLGPQMRSVGEVLALDSSFNSAFLKALRSTEQGLEIPTLSQLNSTPVNMSLDYIKNRLKGQEELCLVTVLEALRLGISKEEIHALSSITPWFIDQMDTIVISENQLKKRPSIIANQDEFLNFKKLGLSDKHMALLTGNTIEDIFKQRYTFNIRPSFKAVDTCSGEFKAITPYFYSTYYPENEAYSLSENDHQSTAVFGSGPNRIGQGIEFDYSCVKTTKHLKELGIKSILLNSNPETVSTDYDSSDRLYLTPLFSEDLFDILYNENPTSIITSFSGQTGINIRSHLEASFRKDIKEFNFLGPTLDLLDLTEDRKRFGEVTKQVDLSQTKSLEIRGYKHLLNAIAEIGLPVIIRPNYVIGGESMYIFNHLSDIDDLPNNILEQLKNSTTTFQVETYLENALEYDVDLIRDIDGNCIFTACEHIEHAGVHSGDSGMISPPVQLTNKTLEKMKSIAKNLSSKMEVVGPINYQFAVKDGQIYCIEANPRGSRTVPFLSKAYDINLAAMATDALLGKEIPNLESIETDTFCVKQSTFPFDRFLQDNIILGPKMRSTGETLGIDKSKNIAILKSYLGNYPELDQKGVILLSIADKHKSQLLPYLQGLQDLGYKFMATNGTYDYIKKQGHECQLVSKLGINEGLDMTEVLRQDDLRIVFNTPGKQGRSKSDGEFIRNTAIQSAVPVFTRIENIKAAAESILGKSNKEIRPTCLQDLSKGAMS